MNTRNTILSGEEGNQTIDNDDWLIMIYIVQNVILLVSGHGLACEQEILLVVAKTPPSITIP